MRADMVVICDVLLCAVGVGEGLIGVRSCVSACNCSVGGHGAALFNLSLQNPLRSIKTHARALFAQGSRQFA